MATCQSDRFFPHMPSGGLLVGADWSVSLGGDAPVARTATANAHAASVHRCNAILPARYSTVDLPHGARFWLNHDGRYQRRRHKLRRRRDDPVGAWIYYLQQIFFLEKR